ncbi:hypothetical protein MRBLWO14_002829 [Microbacterium sp. LWO14-1.2]|uniref:hypothetical protein n=1 Tax=Microbacterium sp. LWO14-1.2 TaxID=3135263 RepID=UPI00313983A9
MDEDELSMPVRAALSAIRGAIPTSGSEDLQEALSSVGTALFWVCALDEQLSKNEGYKSRRNQDPAGRLIVGLRIGRNAVAHGAAIIVKPLAGLTWPTTWPLTWNGAVWADFATVRASLLREPALNSRAKWEEEIAGRNVPDTLTDVHDWLAGCSSS